MTKLVFRLKGGKGSGHFGHRGIPGEQGGSLPGTGGAGVDSDVEWEDGTEEPRGDGEDSDVEWLPSPKIVEMKPSPGASFEKVRPETFNKYSGGVSYEKARKIATTFSLSGDVTKIEIHSGVHRRRGDVPKPFVGTIHYDKKGNRVGSLQYEFYVTPGGKKVSRVYSWDGENPVPDYIKTFVARTFND